METHKEKAVLKVFAPYDDGVFLPEGVHDSYQSMNYKERLALANKHNKAMLRELKPNVYDFLYGDYKKENIKVFVVRKKLHRYNPHHIGQQLLFLKPIDSIIQCYQQENAGCESHWWYKIDMLVLRIEKFFIDRKAKRLHRRWLFGQHESEPEEEILSCVEVPLKADEES